MARRMRIPDWLTTAEMAALFRVHPKVPALWDRQGKFGTGDVTRTPGGHRRYRTTAVGALLGDGLSPDTVTAMIAAAVLSAGRADLDSITAAGLLPAAAAATKGDHL